MSPAAVERALARLAAPGAVLAPDRSGGFAVFARGDRRRRPLARLSAPQVRVLEAEGAIAPAPGGGFTLHDAGRARVRRQFAAPGEAYAAQHGKIVARAVVDAEGDMRPVRGYAPSGVMRRLAGLRNAAGAAWLSGAELAAAAQLRSDWEVAQIGQVRGSDWTAPPIGAGARGQSSAQERALAARCDARRRLAAALDALAPQLRRVVERVCLHEDGIEALERAEGWPARSGKVALKLGLAQLAAAR